MAALFGGEVELDPIPHRYFHKTNRLEYTSVSKLWENVGVKFNAQEQSVYSAEKIVREDRSGAKLDVNKVAAELRQKWSDTNQKSRDHGTRIHNALELFKKTTRIEDKELEEMIRNVFYMFRNYDRTYTEECVYSHKYQVAGTMDVPAFRSSGKKSILDIGDYKTNIEKGIQYEDKYRKFCKAPLDHLEHCNYNEYSIKVSCYAVMAEERGFKIGKLFLIFIDGMNLNKPQYIPIPYMKRDAIALLETNKLKANENRKSTGLPQLVEDDDF